MKHAKHTSKTKTPRKQRKKERKNQPANSKTCLGQRVVGAVGTLRVVAGHVARWRWQHPSSISPAPPPAHFIHTSVQGKPSLNVTGFSFSGNAEFHRWSSTHKLHKHAHTEKHTPRDDVGDLNVVIAPSLPRPFVVSPSHHRSWSSSSSSYTPPSPHIGCCFSGTRSWCRSVILITFVITINTHKNTHERKKNTLIIIITMSEDERNTTHL